MDQPSIKADYVRQSGKDAEATSCGHDIETEEQTENNGRAKRETETETDRQPERYRDRQIDTETVTRQW